MSDITFETKTGALVQVERLKVIEALQDNMVTLFGMNVRTMLTFRRLAMERGLNAMTMTPEQVEREFQR